MNKTQLMENVVETLESLPKYPVRIGSSETVYVSLKDAITAVRKIPYRDWRDVEGIKTAIRETGFIFLYGEESK